MQPHEQVTKNMGEPHKSKLKKPETKMHVDMPQSCKHKVNSLSRGQGMVPRGEEIG